MSTAVDHPVSNDPRVDLNIGQAGTSVQPTTARILHLVQLFIVAGRSLKHAPISHVHVRLPELVPALPGQESAASVALHRLRELPAGTGCFDQA